MDKRRTYGCHNIIRPVFDGRIKTTIFQYGYDQEMGVLRLPADNVVFTPFIQFLDLQHAVMASCLAVIPLLSAYTYKVVPLKARIRSPGGPYYHQFNRLSYMIFSLLPTKANHLPLVIGVLPNQHRSLGINYI